MRIEGFGFSIAILFGGMFLVAVFGALVGGFEMRRRSGDRGQVFGCGVIGFLCGWGLFMCLWGLSFAAGYPLVQGVQPQCVLMKEGKAQFNTKKDGVTYLFREVPDGFEYYGKRTIRVEKGNAGNTITVTFTVGGSREGYLQYRRAALRLADGEYDSPHAAARSHVRKTTSTEEVDPAKLASRLRKDLHLPEGRVKVEKYTVETGSA